MFRKAIDFYHCKQKKNQLYSEISTCNIFKKNMVVDTLKTSSKGIQIKANEVWGAIRGLETLSQLIICINNTVSGKYKYFVLKHSYAFLF